MNTKFNIDIIGAGAMGLLFASRLKLANQTVCLWCRTSEQAKSIQTNGISFEEGMCQGQTVELLFDEVYSFESDNIEERNVDITIVSVKQTAFTPSFITFLGKHKQQTSSKIYIFIQNGIGHLEKVSAVIPPDGMVQAVTSEAALRMNSDSVLHTGYGKTYLSHVETNNDIVNSTVECLNLAGIQSFVSNNVQEYVLKKLIVNTVINPLTALYNIRNGELPQHETRRQLMQKLFQESKSILESYYAVSLFISFEDVLAVCEQTAHNQSSMLSDVLNGRATEIEAINGAIVRLAANINREAPINETVYLLLA